MAQNFRKQWRAWLPELVLFCIFVLVSLLIDSRLSTRLDIDSHKYLALAERLVYAGKFEFPDLTGKLQPEQGRTPVYPVVIAMALLVCNGSKAVAIALVIWAQRLFWVVSMLMLLPKIQRRAGGVHSLVLLSKVLLLFSPPVLLYGSYLLTDLPYAAGLFLATVFTLRSLAKRSPYRTVAVGLIHGILTLLRPFHALLPLVQVLPWLKTRWRLCLIALAISAIAPAGWVIRNTVVNDNMLLANLSGRALALHRERMLRSMVPQSSDSHYGQEFLRALRSTDETAITAAWILQRDYGLTEGQADAVAGNVAREAVVRHPIDYLKQVIQNLRRLFWSPTEGVQLSEIFGATRGGGVAMVAGIVSGLWGVLFFLLMPAVMLITKGSWSGLQAPECQTWLFTALYVIAIPCLTTVTYGRFLLPALPVIALIYCTGLAANSIKQDQ